MLIMKKLILSKIFLFRVSKKKKKKNQHRINTLDNGLHIPLHTIGDLCYIPHNDVIPVIRFFVRAQFTFPLMV